MYVVALALAALFLLLLGGTLGLIWGYKLGLEEGTGSTPKEIKKRAMLLRESMALIHKFLNPTDLDRVDLLSQPSRKEAENLLNRYNEEVK